MKRWFLASFCLLASLWTSVGQNNPYGIDDICYGILQQVETVVDDPSATEFDELNTYLLASAIERGDTNGR